MTKRLILIILLILIIAGVIILPRFLNGGKNSDILMVSGTIEVHNAQLSFRIPGRLENRFVDEGDRIIKGQLLAVLEKTDEEIAAEVAEANLEYALAALSELEAGSRQEEINRTHAIFLQAQYAFEELVNGSREQEIESSKADLGRALVSAETAELKLFQAKADFDRYADLYSDGSISQEQYNLYNTQYKVAQNASREAQFNVKKAKEILSIVIEGARPEKLRKAEAALKQAEAEYDLVKKGPRIELIHQAEARVKMARESFNQAKQKLKYTELYSPMDGIILSKSTEPGEYLNPGSPVVTIGDIKRPWVRAYINETDIGRIKLGGTVQVSTDAFPEKRYKGRISFINSQAEFTPKSVQTFEERVKLMFRIKIGVENPDEELKPGMPADGVIED